MQCSAIRALIATRESPSFMEGRMSRARPSLSRRGRRQTHRLSSGLFRRYTLQRRGNQIFLLLLVQTGNAGGGRRCPGASGIEKFVEWSQLRLQPMADLVPAALILRLFLAPDDLAGILLLAQDRLLFFRCEGVQFLKPTASNPIFFCP